MHRYLFLILLLSWNGLPYAQEVEKPAAPARHIVLLLPLKSASFGAAAEAFRQGFATAAEFQPGLPIEVQPTDDQTADILKAYRQSAQAGAALIVGPLTRDAVTALLDEPLSTPTLALNAPEIHAPLPDKLYLFGLNLESEARQVARLAFARKHRNAVTVTAQTPFSKRLQAAFTDEWLKLGGTLLDRLSFAPNQSGYPKLRAALAKLEPDMLFIAADAERARAVRPYLTSGVPTYATSLVYSGRGEAGRNVDLNQVRFVEMPWFLQADHPAVLVYPRPAHPLDVEVERFYALGIDAWRVAAGLLDRETLLSSPIIDGVTGQIVLTSHQFNRELTAAEFRQGEAVALP
ncbi:MAG: penicillin-binding protein activator [Sulfuricella sp.]|nr:penicillin-binding protein activator [Sulfuricella sp.]